jgi:hypothetical protein
MHISELHPRDLSDGGVQGDKEGGIGGRSGMESAMGNKIDKSNKIFVLFSLVVNKRVHVCGRFE